MPTPLRRLWLLLSVALFGGLLFGETRLASAQQGGDKPPAAAKDARPGVYALLHVERHPPEILGDAPKAAPDPGEPEEYRRTQRVLLRTRLVLGAALRDPAFAKLPMIQQQADPVAWLEKHLRADYLDGTGVLRVSVSAGTPKEQAALANAVADAYLREVVNKEQQTRLARLERLKKLHAEYDDILKGKRDTLRQMMKTLGSRDFKVLDLKQKFALMQLNAVQTELLQVQSQLRRAHLELKLLEENRAAPPEAAVEESIEKDAGVARLRLEVSGLKEKLEEMKKRSSDPEKEPAYKRALGQLEASTRALAARRERLRPAAVAQAREQASGAARLKRQTGLLKELERVLTEDFERRGKEATSAQRGTIDLEWLRDEIAQAEAVSREVARQKQRLEVELEAPPRVRLLEQASAPN